MRGGTLLFALLWYYLRGYVIVEIKGFSIERLINLALKSNIHMWDTYRENDVLYAKLSIADFKALRPYAKKARCKIKLVHKIGLPFVAFRYRKRTMLLFGAALFILSFIVLSSFVWLVEVEGNNKITETDIIATLAEAGYTTGKLKRNLNLREAETYLINKYPDIVWVGMKFEGTRLLVEIAETVPKPSIQNAESPCHIIAKRDGLITYIATYKGIPKVKKGDIVRKGDVLVAGAVPLMEGESDLYYTRAKALIKAKTVYSLKDSISFIQKRKKYTSNIQCSYSIKVLNKKLTFYKGKKLHQPYDTLITNHQLKLTKFFPLPLYFEKEERIEYNLIQVRLSEEEAKEKLLIKLSEELSKMIAEDVKIIDRQISYTKTEKGLIGKLDVIVEEDIGTIQEIQEKGENMNE